MNSDLFGQDPRPRLGISGREKSYWGEKDEWLTPPEIVRALGDFDLDPCVPCRMAHDGFPWRTAPTMMCRCKDGLMSPWPKDARVWMNPPYGPATGTWLKKLAHHGNGVALTFARTETRMFQDEVFQKAGGGLFIRGRVFFHHADGLRAKGAGGAPSILVAYGEANVHALMDSKIVGFFVDFKYGSC
jgi:hypothetical protein